MEVESHAKLLK